MIDRNKLIEKYRKNLNTKMRTGEYIHPLLHSIIGDTMGDNGKNLIVDKTNMSEFVSHYGKPVYADDDGLTDDKGFKLIYPFPNKNRDGHVSIPISVKDTFNEYGYVANSEYLYKMHAYLEKPVIAQMESYLIQNEYKLPIFIDKNIDIADIKKISVNGIELEIDNTYADDFYKDSSNKASDYMGYYAYERSIYGDAYVPNVMMKNTIVNGATGRHLKYIVSNYTEYSSGNVVKNINYSSMMWDSLCLASREMCRHLTWHEWNDMRNAKSPYYPLPIQVTFEYMTDSASFSEMLKNNFNMNFIGYMIIRTFRGSHQFPRPGYLNDSMSNKISNPFATHNLQNEDYLRAFTTNIRVPRSVPSIIITDNNDRTTKHEIKFIPPQWYKSDVKLNLVHAQPPKLTDISIFPKTEGAVCNMTIYKNIDKDNFLKSLDMNAFLLPAERSVMEWHSYDIL